MLLYIAWMLRRAVEICVTWRKTVIALTLVAFAASILGFRFIPQQFFPSASRPELMVDLRLPEGSGFAATRSTACPSARPSSPPAR